MRPCDFDCDALRYGKYNLFSGYVDSWNLSRESAGTPVGCRLERAKLHLVVRSALAWSGIAHAKPGTSPIKLHSVSQAPTSTISASK